MTSELDRGDLIWVNFSPHKGREQAGHRPVMVISPRAYNARSRCILACPVTSNTAPWPWKIPLSSQGEITGAILVDQIRSLDVEARDIRHSGERANKGDIEEAIARLATLTGELK